MNTFVQLGRLHSPVPLSGLRLAASVSRAPLTPASASAWARTWSTQTWKSPSPYPKTWLHVRSSSMATSASCKTTGALGPPQPSGNQMRRPPHTCATWWSLSPCQDRHLPRHPWKSPQNKESRQRPKNSTPQRLHPLQRRHDTPAPQVCALP
nr:MAG: hypothetical protein [Totiviridae sp.]